MLRQLVPRACCYAAHGFGIYFLRSAEHRKRCRSSLHAAITTSAIPLTLICKTLCGCTFLTCGHCSISRILVSCANSPLPQHLPRRRNGITMVPLVLLSRVCKPRPGQRCARLQQCAASSQMACPKTASLGLPIGFCTTIRLAPDSWTRTEYCLLSHTLSCYVFVARLGVTTTDIQSACTAEPMLVGSQYVGRITQS